MSAVTDQLTYLGYRAGWQAVAKLPARQAYGVFDRMADISFRRQGKGVRQLAKNLARVTGEPAESSHVQQLTADGMRSYLRYWCDAFRLPEWDAEQIGTFHFYDLHRLTDPLAAGRGVIAVLPHMGNWDHAGAFMCAHVPAGRVTTVAEKLRPERLYEQFVGFREGLGMTILGLGDAGVYRKLAEVAGAGGLVALLGDRDLSAKGIDIDFFGSRARFPAGAAALAHDTGAALIPLGLFREETRNCAQTAPEIMVAPGADRRARVVATTQAIARSFEEVIAAHPQDWHMLQKVWLADLDQARLRASDAVATDTPEAAGNEVD